jgi:alpha-tubulin suppressor-like RCC1 family protein
MVATTLRFVSIVAGGGHTCALTVAGAAYCWGSNAWGQLGAPTGSACGEPCSLTPVAVEGGFTFASLTAGANHTCGVTPTGAAYCWGNNSNGKLGRTTSFTTPGPVMGNIVFASLAAGAQHTCGLATDGTIYCWGDGQGGALGDGIGGGHVQPLPVLGGLTFTAVSAGWGTSCGVAADSTVYCWGLRYGATGNYFLDRPTQVASRHFASISVGTDHYCGVGADAVGYCWGANRFGQNGVGHSTPLDTPTAVDAVFTFVQLSGGGQHSCGIAADGFAYCWGSNAWGQLGRIGGDVFSSPVLIEGQQ